MADAEPAAEQLLTLQCGERTLETLDWESVLRTQGEDFWDDARFLAGDLNDTPIALLDKDWEGDECERRSFVVRDGFGTRGCIRYVPQHEQIYYTKGHGRPTGSVVLEACKTAVAPRARALDRLPKRPLYGRTHSCTHSSSRAFSVALSR